MADYTSSSLYHHLTLPPPPPSPPRQLPPPTSHPLPSLQPSPRAAQSSKMQLKTHRALALALLNTLHLPLILTLVFCTITASPSSSQSTSLGVHKDRSSVAEIFSCPSGETSQDYADTATLYPDTADCNTFIHPHDHSSDGIPGTGIISPCSDGTECETFLSVCSSQDL